MVNRIRKKIEKNSRIFGLVIPVSIPHCSLNRKIDVRIDIHLILNQLCSAIYGIIIEQFERLDIMEVLLHFEVVKDDK
ncbi:unnamed protein product [Caenorhabditis angaria]|uniref:Uncharacterized protein n=1 Tax=Caenorhabditis angaria TaxID=860376 RepID=A0A9P1I9T9_9PELO|nr:unnamed protein product [Caenorhabditis angaria]